MIAFLIALFTVIADQVSKLIVLDKLVPIKDVPLWDGVFHLHYTENTGAAFGMLSGNQWLFFIFVGVAIVGIIYFIIRYRKQIPTMALISFGLILGGAIGNYIDRLRLGYVVDFLYFKLINFAIFNVADMAVTIGAILLCIFAIFFYEKHMEKMKTASVEGNETK